MCMVCGIPQHLSDIFYFYKPIGPIGIQNNISYTVRSCHTC